MKGYIDGTDFFNLSIMKYWNFPNSWDIDKKKTTVNQRIFSGEWLGAQSGLGYFSRRMMTQLDGAGVFAPILLLSAAAMVLVALIAALERRVITWRNEM